MAELRAEKEIDTLHVCTWSVAGRVEEGLVVGQQGSPPGSGEEPHPGQPWPQ